MKKPYDQEEDDRCTLCAEYDEDCECEIVEECPRCMTVGVIIGEDDLMYICDKCDARCYIPHKEWSKWNDTF